MYDIRYDIWYDIGYDRDTRQELELRHWSIVSISVKSRAWRVLISMIT
jgi:hypothetical protein